MLYKDFFPAGELCSSFWAENVALLEALTWISKDLKSALIYIQYPPGFKQQIIAMQRQWSEQSQAKTQRDREPSSPALGPSHCGLEGNERADVLADEGTKISQENVSVSEAIVKGKIKAREWQPEHQRSIETYRNKRTPKTKIESKWSRSVCTQHMQGWERGM